MIYHITWMFVLALAASCFSPEKPKAQPIMTVPFKQIKFAEKLCKKNGGVREFTKTGFVCRNELEWKR
jgi:hypothetical protein